MYFVSILRRALARMAAPAAYSAASAAVFCVVAMMFIVTFDVVARYVFNSPTMWAGEIASYLMIAIVFLGLAQNLHQGSHIRIDVVTNVVPARVRLFLEVIAYAIAVVFTAMLFGGCWIRFDNFWVRQTTSASPLMTELWIPMLPVLLGVAIFCLVALAGFVKTFLAVMTGDSVPLDDTGEA